MSRKITLIIDLLICAMFLVAFALQLSTMESQCREWMSHQRETREKELNVLRKEAARRRERFGRSMLHTLNKSICFLLYTYVTSSYARALLAF